MLRPSIPILLCAALLIGCQSAGSRSADAPSSAGSGSTAAASQSIALTEAAAQNLEGRYTGRWRGPRSHGPYLTLDIDNVDLQGGTVSGVYGWQFVGRDPGSSPFTTDLGNGSFQFGDNPIITFYFNQDGELTRGSWVHRRHGAWTVTPRRS